jgi:hypothetical protein
MRRALAVALCLLLPSSVPGRRRPQGGPRIGGGAAKHLRAMPLARALPGPGQVAVGRFLSSLHVPVGPRARARVGDYFIRSSQLVAVLRSGEGELVDLALAPDFIDRMGWSHVRLCDAKGSHRVRVQEVRIVTTGTPALEVRGVLDGEQTIGVQTSYRLPGAGGVVEIATEVINRGTTERAAIGVCDDYGLGNTRLHVPGIGEVRRPMTTRARFCGRSERGVSYALAVVGEPMTLSLEMWPPLGAFDPEVVAAYGRATLGVGQRRLTTRVLAVRRGGLHLAVGDALGGAGLPMRRVTVDLKGALRESQVVIRQDGKPFLTSDAERVSELQLPLAGTFSLSQRIPGAGEGPAVKLGAGAAVVLEPPAAGTLRVKVREGGEPRGAKLLLTGEGRTPTPSWPADGGLRGDRVVYVARGVEEIALAPGTYHLTATRGFAYELEQARVTIRHGRTTEALLQLRRVVWWPGWSSADLHVHSEASFDCPHTAQERLAAAAALDVELIAATDHNTLTTYPAAAPPATVLTVRGEEVTSEGKQIGHFNVFPLPSGQPLSWRDTTPAQVFAAARQIGGAQALIQVNHPRMGSIGYFDQMGMSAGRASNPAYRDGYQLLEVLNGDLIDRPGEVDKPLRDWYALLDRGQRVTATGNSDSHRLPYQDLGYPRNLVLWDAGARGKTARRAPSTQPAPTVERLLGGLREGRSQITTGPTVFFTVEGQPLGALVRAKGRAVQAKIVVEAPSWIDVSSVTLVVNGRALKTFAVKGGTRRRFERTQAVPLACDSWMVVIARGARPDVTSQRKGVLPFAVTNPIWVDVDGDGRFTPAQRPAASAPQP